MICFHTTVPKHRWLIALPCGARRLAEVKTLFVRFAIAMAAGLALVAGQAPPDAPSSGATFGTVVVATTGFKGEIYYLHRGIRRLPDFNKLKKPKGAIYTPVLNVPTQNFDKGFPGLTHRFEWFGIDYHAHFWVKTPGEYKFSLLADDGADLYIDDRLIIDDDGQHPPELQQGSAELTAGAHSIHVTYYQGPRYQVALVLKVEPPGHDTFELFNTNDYTPPPDVTNW